MDRDRDNLWTRRSGNSKLSLATNDNDNSRDASTRVFSATKSRFGGDTGSHSSRNAPLNSAGIASPSGAFGLGTGAFASFGSANKTPKTPGTAFDWGAKSSSSNASASKDNGSNNTSSNTKTLTRQGSSLRTPTMLPKSSEEPSTTSRNSTESIASSSDRKKHPLRYTWIIYYRPPTSKTTDYEASIHPLCRFSSIEEFWAVFVHLKHPSLLPHVSDYHFFREGIRPVWEDEANKKGGKWILRLKKGVVDRYWEELLMCMAGDMFVEASEEVCGAVVSVRANEDVISVWTRNDGGRNIKIRETVKRVLNLPADTIIVWKSHDDSISQRTAIDQAREQKPRRATLASDDGAKPGAS